MTETEDQIQRSKEHFHKMLLDTPRIVYKNPEDIDILISHEVPSKAELYIYISLQEPGEGAN